MTNLERLPATGAKGRVHVVVETPKGATAKFKFDAKLGAFKFVRSLKGTLAYPFDWGFVPSTRGEDGDPLDAMILHNDASFPGAVLACYPVGILEVEQTEKGQTVRNDRVIFVPADDAKIGVEKLERLKPKLERFFKAAIAGTGKTLVYRGWRDADGAAAAIHKATAVPKKKKAGPKKKPRPKNLKKNPKKKPGAKKRR